jgi:hypothetical protein
MLHSDIRPEHDCGSTKSSEWPEALVVALSAPTEVAGNLTEVDDPAIFNRGPRQCACLWRLRNAPQEGEVPTIHTFRSQFEPLAL